MAKRNKRGNIPHPFRSWFEYDVSCSLEEKGQTYTYEKESFELWFPVQRGHRCGECGSRKVLKESWYTPDFFLPNGVVIESKGKFTPLDRKKVLAMKNLHTSVDLRLLFQFDNKLSKNSKTRYSTWCESLGIPYALGTEVPASWLK